MPKKPVLSGAKKTSRTSIKSPKRTISVKPKSTLQHSKASGLQSGSFLQKLMRSPSASGLLRYLSLGPSSALRGRE